MEKRSAARELAFLVLFQLPQKTDKIDIDKLTKTDLHALCLSAIRTLVDHAKSNIKSAEAFFIQTERFLMEHQINHPDNESLDEASRSVALPHSKEFFDNIDKCYQALAFLRESINIPEIYWHYHEHDIQEFTLTLLLHYINNKESIQNHIKEVSKSWDFSRMQKIDRTIIELASTELLHSDLPVAVVITEAMKLANKYSTEEGAKFINGILADIVQETVG